MPAESEVLFQGKRIRVVKKSYQARDGAVHFREVVEHPGSVTVLPLLDDQRLVLTRNYRVTIDEWLIELPAGTLEPGEDPAQCARRELAEETGYRATKIDRLHEFVVSPGVMGERMHLFVATGLTPGQQDLDAGEEIDVFTATWDEALAMVQDGRIKDAKTLIGLLYYDRFRRRGR